MKDYRKWGILGLGNIAREFAENMKETPPDLGSGIKRSRKGGGVRSPLSGSAYLS